MRWRDSRSGKEILSIQKKAEARHSNAPQSYLAIARAGERVSMIGAVENQSSTVTSDRSRSNVAGRCRFDPQEVVYRTVGLSENDALRHRGVVVMGSIPLTGLTSMTRKTNARD